MAWVYAEDWKKFSDGCNRKWVPDDPDNARLEVAVDASWGKVSFPGAAPPLERRKTEYKPRGVITRFSKQSKSRLWRIFQQIKRNADLPLFITLTYHRELVSAAEAKSNLHDFVIWLRRKYPEAAGIWKIEPQKRGTPHFHLCVWNVRFIPHEVIGEAWNWIAEPGDMEHLKAGVQVVRVKNRWHLFSYMSKYMGKFCECPESWGSPGRFWGVLGRDKLPRKIKIIDLTWKQAWAMRRLFAKWIDKRGLYYSPRHWSKETSRPGGSGFWGVTAFMEWEPVQKFLAWLGVQYYDLPETVPF